MPENSKTSLPSPPPPTPHGRGTRDANENCAIVGWWGRGHSVPSTAGVGERAERAERAHLPQHRDDARVLLDKRLHKLREVQLREGCAGASEPADVTSCLCSLPLLVSVRALLPAAPTLNAVAQRPCHARAARALLPAARTLNAVAHPRVTLSPRQVRAL